MSNRTPFTYPRTSPSGPSRSASASDRRAEVDWLPVSRQPENSLWATVRTDPSREEPTRRVLFNGRYWMTRQPFSAWKPCPSDERPASEIVDTIKATTGEGVLEEMEQILTPPADLIGLDEMERASLAELARMELKVDVIRLYKPGENASGVLSGKVLATSNLYAAQSIGENAVMIHEQAKLGRRVSAGEQVTLDYKGGRAQVYNGALFDVNIKAPFLSTDQLGWMRLQMIEALASVEGADKDDNLIREALRYALEKTAIMFGLENTSLTHANIKLSVVDPITPRQLENAAAIDRAAGDLELMPLSAHSRPRLR